MAAPKLSQNLHSTENRARAIVIPNFPFTSWHAQLITLILSSFVDGKGTPSNIIPCLQMLLFLPSNPLQPPSCPASLNPDPPSLCLIQRHGLPSIKRCVTTPRHFSFHSICCRRWGSGDPADPPPAHSTCLRACHKTHPVLFLAPTQPSVLQRTTEGIRLGTACHEPRPAPRSQPW